MQLHLKILCNCILISNLILQKFSCLNQPFSFDLKYLWTFQPISVLDIFQKLQYPYTVLFHYFSTMNGQIFVKFVACTSNFIVLFVLYGYCSNMNHFSCIIRLNWVDSSALHSRLTPPTHHSRLKSARVCASYGCNEKFDKKKKI